MTKPKLYFSLAFLLIPLLTACTSEVATLDMSVTPFPIGTYKSLEWSWVFEEDGTYYYYPFDQPDNTSYGEYTLTGDQIVIKDDMCAGGEEGKYQWEFDGEALKFTLIREACSGRSQYMVALPWSLEQ